MPAPYEAPMDELGPLKVMVDVLLMSVDAWTAALESIRDADRNTPKMTFFIEWPLGKCGIDGCKADFYDLILMAPWEQQGSARFFVEQR
jgi:hypothetical protein